MGSKEKRTPAGDRHMHHYLYCIVVRPTMRMAQMAQASLHPSLHLLSPKIQLHSRRQWPRCSLAGLLQAYWIRMKCMNDGYKHTAITVYYNYEQEVLLRVLRHLPQEQLAPNPPRTLRWQETQTTHDRTLPTDTSPDGGRYQGQKQQHDMTSI